VGAEGNHVSTRTTPAQRWIGLGIAFVCILAIAGAAILALGNRGGANDKYVKMLQANAAEQGVDNVTKDEATCMLDVVDDYMSLDQIVETFEETGVEADLSDLSDKEGMQFAFDVLTECPTLSEKLGLDSGLVDDAFADEQMAQMADGQPPTPPTTKTPPAPEPPAPLTTEPPAPEPSTPPTTVPPDQKNSYDGDGIGCDALYRDALNAPEGPEGDDEWAALGANECIVGE
jgi:hypothetical protein